MFRAMKLIFVMLLGCCLVSGIGFAEIKISDHIDSFKLKGDLRVRFERHDRDRFANSSGEDLENPRDRLRTRFRLGASWKAKEEKWEIGAGLATGGGDSTSTNDTWSEDGFFETGDIRLDYAYAKHTLEIPGIKKINLIAGQQKNPFKTSWLLWDSDVRPTGFTGHADLGMVFGTFGIYDFIQNGNDMGIMTALQAGAQFTNGNISFLGTLSGYFFSNTPFVEDGNPPFTFSSNASAQMANIDEIENGNIELSDGTEYTITSNDFEESSDYSYQIIDIYGKIDIDLPNKVKISPYAQIFFNMGADGKKGEGYLIGDYEPDSENMGWVLGVDAKVQNASFKISYAQVGADSCVPGLKNGDFGSSIYDGVNVQGAVIAAGYKITKHFSAELTAYFYEPMTDKIALFEEIDDDRLVFDRYYNEDKRNMQLYHLDLKYKF
jgi:hypothetical protein